MKLLPCPFCGSVPDFNNDGWFGLTDGQKWGAVKCCCTGPEVRTGYRPVAEWKTEAAIAWNDRAFQRKEGE